MQNPEIVIIGAAIIDVLAYPVNVKVFETGSYSTEDIHMTTGADALNEATILAKKGRRVQLETVIGQDDAGKFIQAHCNDAGIMVRDACIKKDEKTGVNCSCGARWNKKFLDESTWYTSKPESRTYPNAIS